MELRIVELRDRRGVHHVTAGYFRRVGVGGGDVRVLGDILVELDVHQAVLFQRMHAPGLGLARL
jgi:hypothetical protein